MSSPPSTSSSLSEVVKVTRSSSESRRPLNAAQEYLNRGSLDRLPRTGGSLSHGSRAPRPANLAPMPRSPSASSISFANRSPSIASFANTPRTPTSPASPTMSTHAGGILPSASFFRPMRPSDQPRPPPDALPPPAMNGTETASPPDGHVMDIGTDGLQLASLARQLTNVSEVSTSGGRTSYSTDGVPSYSRAMTSRSTKSREPLLPIGVKREPITHNRTLSKEQPSTPTRSRPSEDRFPPAPPMFRGNSDKSSGENTGNRMRNSLEQIFRRTLSIDTGNRGGPTIANQQLAAGANSPVDGELTFETKRSLDDDDSIFHRSLSASRGRPASKRSAPRTRPREGVFIPLPPAGQKQKPRFTPVLDEKTGQTLRRWKLHPSRNTFFMDGRILTGGDSPKPFLGSLCVLFGITGVWFGTTAVWWWTHMSPAVAAVGAYMCLLTISSMFVTAFSDPGILPRDLDPAPPYSNLTPSDGGDPLPLPRDLQVRSGYVRVKYCPTCKTYRPPRSSHCKMCDNCVDGCDHHCQWVNNCVGRRNYTSFIVLLTSATLTLCLVIVTSVLHLIIQAHQEGLSAQESLKKGAGSAVAFCLAIIVVWPVSALLAYHMRLLLLNITTIEQIRNSAHKTLGVGPAPPNPFTMGSWRRNLAVTLCRPRGYSWLDAHAAATEDKRTLNPGTVQREGEA